MAEGIKMRNVFFVFTKKEQMVEIGWRVGS